jgi:hypothetical protein
MIAGATTLFTVYDRGAMSRAMVLLLCAVALIACSSDNDQPDLRVINGPASVDTTTTTPTTNVP